MVVTSTWGSPTDASSAERISHPYPEWGEPTAGGPIRQGDVLSAIASDSDQWHQLLVVITADCDLANAKHGGALTCVPVLPLFDYLAQFRTEKTRNSLQRRIIGTILDGLRRPGDQEAEHRISEARMVAWLTEESPAGIMASLTDWTVSEQVPELLSLAHALVHLHEQDLVSILDCLAAIKVGLGDARDLASARTSLANDLASSLRNLPGDTLLLNEVSAIHSRGYVVYLRRVVELADTRVATTYSRIPHSVQYIRISRLRSPYIYALTQQFAAVFSAIGLPDIYEAACNSIAQKIKLGAYS